jgi:hypothetical protein
VHYNLTHSNKGMEGLHFHEDGKGTEYLLTLCEGNLRQLE